MSLRCTWCGRYCDTRYTTVGGDDLCDECGEDTESKGTEMAVSPNKTISND